MFRPLNTIGKYVNEWARPNNDLVFAECSDNWKFRPPPAPCCRRFRSFAYVYINIHTYTHIDIYYINSTVRTFPIKKCMGKITFN